MKKRVLSIILAMIFLIGACATEFIVSATSISAGYSTVSTHESQKFPINGAKVVTFGDSITQYAGWQDELEAVGATVVNAGTAAQTVNVGMETFGTRILDEKPDFATIMYGLNDGNKGKSTGNGTEQVSISLFKEYYRAFVKNCRDNNIIPVIITQHTCIQDIWYTEGSYAGTESFYESDGGVAKWFDLYSEAAREVATELDVNLIDWNAYSKTFDETSIISTDSMHLTTTGKDKLGELVADYFSTNFPGDASTAEKTTYPKPNTVLIEDFSTKGADEFVNFNNAQISITDEMSTGNNALKIYTSGTNSAVIPTGSKPENAIGLRFKFRSKVTNYRIITFNSETQTSSSCRISDYAGIKTYVKDVWTTCDFYFADYPAKSGYSYDDLKAFLVIAGYSSTSYYDDVEWILEGEQSETVSTSASEENSTVTSTTTTTTEAVAEEEYYTIEDVSVADNWRVGQYDMNNGSYSSSSTNRACLKKLVKVDPTKTYILNATNASGKNFVLREYDANMAFVKSYGTVNLGKTYTPSSSSVAYVGVTLYEGAPLASIQAGTIVPSMVEYGAETSSTSTTTTTTTSTSSTGSTSSTSSSAQSGVINLTTGTVYDKLQSAISAATAGDTLKLLSDLSVDAGTSGISIGKTLTIDLGGNTLTSSNKRLFNVTANSNATLTIKKGSLVVTATNADIPIVLRATNDLNLEDLNVTGISNNYGFVTVLSPSTTDPSNVTVRNCTITNTTYIFSDYNASNAPWNLYIYNSDLSTTASSVILKKDNNKAYDSIIYSGHIKNATLNTAHYPNLKIADTSYMTKTENGSQDTATTSFAAEYWVYEKGAQVTTPEVSIVMVAGAQVRFNEVTGMRYRATVDKDAIEQYEADGYTVTMGTLIAPADFFDNYEDLTFDTTKTYLDVVTTGYYNEELGTIAGSIANIKETNYGRNFIARAYVKLTKDGETYVSYATENDNTRSIKYLAQAVIDDGSYASEAQLAWLEKWAAAADWQA